MKTLYRRYRQMIVLSALAALLLARYAEPYRPLPREASAIYKVCYYAALGALPMCVDAPGDDDAEGEAP
jgi:hypothetical protein